MALICTWRILGLLLLNAGHPLNILLSNSSTYLGFWRIWSRYRLTKSKTKMKRNILYTEKRAIKILVISENLCQLLGYKGSITQHHTPAWQLQLWWKGPAQIGIKCLYTIRGVDHSIHDINNFAQFWAFFFLSSFNGFLLSTSFRFFDRDGIHTFCCTQILQYYLNKLSLDFHSHIIKKGNQRNTDSFLSF